MRWPEKLVVPVVCLGLVLGAPAALTQAIPKSLLRLCLRNVATGIACYVVGRGGELIVDGSLSAAWAKAKETVTGEAPASDKVEPKPPSPTQLGPKPPPALPNAIVEPLTPTDLGALSKRLPGSASKRLLTEGFAIYDRPHDPPESLVPKAPAGTSATPQPTLSDLARPKSLWPQYVWPKLAPPKYGERLPGSDPYLTPNAGKLVPPTTPLTAAQFGTLQSECQRRRERETGLSFLAILGAPDFDAKLKRRMEEVIKPCISPGRY
jgi:hypothetical protein